MIRRDFPEVFQRRCEQSRELNVRLTRLHGERIFLDELPPGLPVRRSREHLLRPGLLHTS